MDDLIYRQEMKKELMKKALFIIKDEFFKIIQILDELPSIPPDDLVSRPAAIDAIKELKEQNGGNNYFGIYDLDLIIDVLLEIPPAKPEIIRCKDCKKKSKCYSLVLMQSESGEHVYYSVDYCSNVERK